MFLPKGDELDSIRLLGELERKVEQRISSLQLGEDFRDIPTIEETQESERHQWSKR